MASPHVVVANWRARADEAERVAALLRELTGATRAEPGCRDYVVHRNVTDPASFLIYEVYDDEAAFAAHHASGHFQRIAKDTAIPLLEGRDVRTYEVLPGEVTT